MTSVLFVCLGNICRSPLAEGALRAAAERAGLDIAADSAGTGDWHVGAPPDRRAQAAARLAATAPADATAELGLLMDLVPGREGSSVADPYFGTDRDFDTTWAEVSAAAEALVARLGRSG